MDFEDIIEDLGAFGHWQRVIFVLISVADVFGAFAMLIPVFIGATPTWRCNKFEAAGENGTTLEILPPSNDSIQQCTVKEIYKCTNFTFDDDFTSIVSEWNLICDHKYLSDLITSVQFVGLILGAGTFGQVSGTIGRKKAYFIAFSIMILFSCISAFSPVIEMYAACRFFVGVGFGAIMVVNCVYPLEFVGRQWRTLCGTLGFWGIGGMVLAFFGYLLREWRYLLILTSTSGVFYYITWLFIPESPRWLALQERFEEAEQILEKIAEKNKKPPPDLSTLKQYVNRDRAEEEKLKKYTYLDLFRTRRHCKRVLILIVVWFTVFIMYYGLAYNLRNLSGNRYLNMFLAAFLDMAAMLSVILSDNNIGRRWSQILFLTLAILSNIVIISVIATGGNVSLADLILAAALIGKAAALAGTYVAQIWTAELFPTVIRNQGIGVGSVSARIGNVLAPQIVFLGTYYELSPHIITTSLCLLSFPLIFLLPETNGQPLEDDFHPRERPKEAQNTDKAYLENTSL